MKIKGKSSMLIGAVISVSIVNTFLNFNSFNKENGVIEMTLGSLIKTAYADWEEPNGQTPVDCAITTGTGGGEFLYLICTSENHCLWGYEPYVRTGSCLSYDL